LRLIKTSAAPAVVSTLDARTRFAGTMDRLAAATQVARVRSQDSARALRHDHDNVVRLSAEVDRLEAIVGRLEDAVA
jgi:hypothetical protein